MNKIDKNGVIINKLTGEVLYDPKQFEGREKEYYYTSYQTGFESAVNSFKKHVRYEKNDGESLCDRTPPMTISQLYEYFVMNNQPLPNPFISDKEFSENESNIDIDEPINQYDNMDDLIEKKEYYDSLQNNSVLNKGEVKQSETTTEIKTDEVKQENNNIQEKKE